MDRRVFINPESVIGTTVEGKILALLNGFDTPEDFDAIVDRYGFGYAEDREGYGIDRPTAERLLAAKPDGGWTSLTQLIVRFEPFTSSVVGFGRDKFSDLVVSAIALSGGVDQRTITGSFRRIDPDGAQLNPPNMTEPIDVIVFGKFAGATLDQIFPIHIVETDENGEFTIEHVTNDYEEFALVGAFRESEEVFHRSGLIPIQSFPHNRLEYRPLLVNQEFVLDDSDFRGRIEEQAGKEIEDNKRLDSITSDFKDEFIEIRGKIVAPDTFLWFDSNITFTSHIRYLPTQFASNWVRDLTEIMGVSSEVVEQSHSNDGFILASILSFLVPGAGIAIGSIVTVVFLAIDAGQDSSLDTKSSIENALRDEFSNQTLSTFQAAIQEEVDNADAITRVGLVILSDFDETPADPLQAIIDFMASHVTVQTVEIDTDEMKLNLWLTLPFTI